jgi:hypothetical protein
MYYDEDRPNSAISYKPPTTLMNTGGVFGQPSA